MGLMKSFKKSKIMKQIEKIQTKPYDTSSFRAMMLRSDEEDKAFEELFTCMSQLPGCAEVLQKHRTSAAEIQSISSRISLAYDYRNGHYIPVSLVSFCDTLDYLLTNKDSILKHGVVEMQPIIDRAIAML